MLAVTMMRDSPDRSEMQAKMLAETIRLVFVSHGPSSRAR
jgi:hypothetical protein